MYNRSTNHQRPLGPHIDHARHMNTRHVPMLLIAFWPLTALVLLLDSRAAAGLGVAGQGLSDLLAPAFLVLLIRPLAPERQLLAVLFVPISAVGEGLFSLVLGLYHYRLGGVPVYVPFGHAILLCVGLYLADTPWLQRYERRVRAALIFFHGGLIGGAFVLLGDTLSAIFGGIFALVLLRQRGRPFYLIMGVLVLYIELLGTVGGNWRWDLAPWGVLHTTNPPTGAFACYVIADIIAMKTAARLALGLARRRAARPRPWFGASAPRPAEGDQAHAGQDDDHGQQAAGIDLLMRQRDPQRHGDDRVDVGIAGGHGRPHVPQQIAIGAESDH